MAANAAVAASMKACSVGVCRRSAVGVDGALYVAADVENAIYRISKA